MKHFVLSCHQIYWSEWKKKWKLFTKDPLYIKDWKVLKIEKEMILQSRLILCSKCFDKKTLPKETKLQILQNTTSEMGDLDSLTLIFFKNSSWYHIVTNNSKKITQVRLNSTLIFLSQLVRRLNYESSNIVKVK